MNIALRAGGARMAVAGMAAWLALQAEGEAVGVSRNGGISAGDKRVVAAAHFKKRREALMSSSRQ